MTIPVHIPVHIPAFDSEAAHAAIVMKDAAVGIGKNAYTVDDLEADIRAVDARLSPIRVDRGSRYGSAEDTLRNVRECDPEGSWRGAYVSAVECTNRLRNMFFTKADDMDWDDFDNATDDLINYAYYIKILGNQKRGKL